MQGKTETEREYAMKGEDKVVDTEINTELKELNKKIIRLNDRTLVLISMLSSVLSPEYKSTKEEAQDKCKSNLGEAIRKLRNNIESILDTVDDAINRIQL